MRILNIIIISLFTNQYYWLEKENRCIRGFITSNKVAQMLLNSLKDKVILSSSDRYKIFTSDWLWIEICQSVSFSKIEITMTTITKKLKIDKRLILRDLDLLLKIQHLRT